MTQIFTDRPPYPKAEDPYGDLMLRELYERTAKLDARLRAIGDLAGAAGPTGPRGPQGEQGPPGAIIEVAAGLRAWSSVFYIDEPPESAGRQLRQQAFRVMGNQSYTHLELSTVYLPVSGFRDRMKFALLPTTQYYIHDQGKATEVVNPSFNPNDNAQSEGAVYDIRGEEIVTSNAVKEVVIPHSPVPPTNPDPTRGDMAYYPINPVATLQEHGCDIIARLPIDPGGLTTKLTVIFFGRYFVHDSPIRW